ncbi:MAG: flavin reductase family protein, partial [Lentisphaeria bacterium]
DYCGIAKYAGIDKNKFSAMNLTAVKADYVNAPYADEFPLVLECRVVHTYEQGIHTMFIAEIIDVKADCEVLSDSDKLEISKIDPIIFTPGTRSYHSVGNYIGQAFDIGLLK